MRVKTFSCILSCREVRSVIQVWTTCTCQHNANTESLHCQQTLTLSRHRIRFTLASHSSGVRLSRYLVDMTKHWWFDVCKIVLYSGQFGSGGYLEFDGTLALLKKILQCHMSVMVFKAKLAKATKEENIKAVQWCPFEIQTRWGPVDHLRKGQVMWKAFSYDHDFIMSFWAGFDI